MAIVAGTLAGLATSNYVAGITTFTIMEFNVAAAIAGASSRITLMPAKIPTMFSPPKRLNV